jgi:hypothetical protein
MARTQKEIYESLIARKDANSVLSVQLTDAREIATYNQMLHLVAGEIALFEQNQDNHLKVVNDRAEEGVVGSVAWYGWSTKNVFQYSDTLIFSNGFYGYAIENDLLKIVVFASSEAEGGRVILKCAKANSDGLATPLSAAEKTNLQGFWDKYSFQTPVSVVSQAGDEVYLQATIEYDANILSSTGQLLSDTDVYPVEDAINEFYSSFQIQGNFANIFYIRKLEDAVQAVPGVANLVITKCDIKPLGGDYNDILATSLKKYNSAAGWVQEDSLNPLSSNLTYSAI